ncbi:MAG: Pilus assembly protein PilO, partial [Actinomycetota bacterium]|nr:Pilus assembly protein PilO [Actinomycetota bacterium]
VSGGYFEVLDYLDRLNALPRIVVVDSLGLTTGDAGKTITVSVTARMFSMTAPQVAPTTTTVLAPPPGGSSKGGSSTTTAPRAGATAP